MWGKGKKRKITKIDTLVGQRTELRGDVVFSGGLHVDGTIQGNVLAETGEASVLTVSEHGRIEGEVRVPNVVLNGTVQGDVYADERIELAPRARVTGNVYYNLIEMAMGAEVNGNLVHRTEQQASGVVASVAQRPVTSATRHGAEEVSEERATPVAD
jgi:cytoskeletal protein CcmA (bactofilin family)